MQSHLWVFLPNKRSSLFTCKARTQSNVIFFHLETASTVILWNQRAISLLLSLPSSVYPFFLTSVISSEQHDVLPFMFALALSVSAGIYSACGKWKKWQNPENDSDFSLPVVVFLFLMPTNFQDLGTTLWKIFFNDINMTDAIYLIQQQQYSVRKTQFVQQHKQFSLVLL